jgi:hypothetical protein
LIVCVCLFITFSMCYSFTFPCRFIRNAFTAVRVAQCVHVCINGLPRTIISISGIVVVLLCTLYCYYLGKCMVRIDLIALIVWLKIVRHSSPIYFFCLSLLISLIVFLIRWIRMKYCNWVRFPSWQAIFWPKF